MSGYCLVVILLAAFGIITTSELGLYGSLIDLISEPTSIQESIWWKGIFAQFAITLGVSAIIFGISGLLGGSLTNVFWRDPKLILSSTLMGSIIVPMFQSIIEIWSMLSNAIGGLFSALIIAPFFVPMIMVAYDWWKN